MKHFSLVPFFRREREPQEAMALWRTRLMRPLLVLFAMLGIKPDHLSLLSFLSMLLLPFGFFVSPWYALAAYVLHLFFDAADGALARHTKTSSPRGAYTDTLVDHAALFITALTLTWFNSADPFWLLLYTLSTFVLVLHLVVLNAIGKPPSFPVLRTKYVLFLLTLGLLWDVIEPDLLSSILMWLAVYTTGMVLVYVVIFRWEIGEK